MKVIVTLPDNHPQSEQALQSIECPDCRARALQQKEAFTLRCPYCCGTLPMQAKWCAWCTRPVQAILN